jgi:hypothetical protein
MDAVVWPTQKDGRHDKRVPHLGTEMSVHTNTLMEVLAIHLVPAAKTFFEEMYLRTQRVVGSKSLRLVLPAFQDAIREEVGFADGDAKVRISMALLEAARHPHLCQLAQELVDEMSRMMKLPPPWQTVDQDDFLLSFAKSVGRELWRKPYLLHVSGAGRIRQVVEGGTLFDSAVRSALLSTVSKLTPLPFQRFDPEMSSETTSQYLQDRPSAVGRTAAPSAPPRRPLYPVDGDEGASSTAGNEAKRESVHSQEDRGLQTRHNDRKEQEECYEDQDAAEVEATATATAAEAEAETEGYDEAGVCEECLPEAVTKESGASAVTRGGDASGARIPCGDGVIPEQMSGEFPLPLPEGGPGNDCEDARGSVDLRRTSGEDVIAVPVHPSMLVRKASRAGGARGESRHRHHSQQEDAESLCASMLTCAIGMDDSEEEGDGESLQLDTLPEEDPQES